MATAALFIVDRVNRQVQQKLFVTGFKADIAGQYPFPLFAGPLQSGADRDMQRIFHHLQGVMFSNPTLLGLQKLRNITEVMQDFAILIHQQARW